MSIKNIKLSEIRPGEQARVLGFLPTSAGYRRRLLAMGLTPGVQFECLRRAPFGDPVAIRLRGGAVLTLRQEEAACLELESVSDGLP